MVVVNLSASPAQAQIPLPWPEVARREWNLEDLLSGEVFTRDGAHLDNPGLYGDLQPGQFYLLAVH